MGLVTVDYERMSVVPASECVVRITVPVVAVACALHAPSSAVAVKAEDELLGCAAASHQ